MSHRILPPGLQVMRCAHLSRTGPKSSRPRFTGAPLAAPAPASAPAPAAPATGVPRTPADKIIEVTTGHIVKSPMVGTFYRSPSPGAKAFVEFVLTDGFQDLHAETNAVYPVVDGIDVAKVYGARIFNQQPI